MYFMKSAFFASLSREHTYVHTYNIYIPPYHRISRRITNGHTLQIYIHILALKKYKKKKKSYAQKKNQANNATLLEKSEI